MTPLHHSQGFHFSDVYLPHGWQQNVSVLVDDNGYYSSIEQDDNPSKLPVIGGITIPGTANLHSHAFQRAMAGLAEKRGDSNDSFWSWRDTMYRFVNIIEPDDLYAIASKLYIDFLKGGFTSVAEFHYLHNALNGQRYENIAEMSLAIRRAAVTSGIALTHLPVFYAHSGFGGKPANEGQRRFVNNIDSYEKLLIELAISDPTEKTLFRLGIAPHSLRAITPDELTAIQGLRNAITPDGPIHIHISEQKQEVRDCIDHFGVRPIDWLMDNAPVDKTWCLVHATHATPNELSKMASSGAVVGLCPMTEANLGDGIFAAAEFVEQGGSIGVGTDSNIRTNLADELQMLEYGQRLNRQGRNVLASDSQPNVGDFLVTQVNSGGKLATGQPKSDVSVGSRADFIVFPREIDGISWSNGSDYLNYWLFAALDKSPSDVYVAAKQMITGGKHIADEQVNAKFNRTMRHLLQKL